MSEAPFISGDKVICIDDRYPNPAFKGKARKGEVWTVCSIEYHFEKWYLSLDGDDLMVDGDRYMYCATRFRKVEDNSYTADATKELIEKVFIGDNADQPVKILEPSTN